MTWGSREAEEPNAKGLMQGTSQRYLTKTSEISEMKLARGRRQTMLDEKQESKNSTTEIWLCNTYQSILLMNSHSECKSAVRNRQILIVPSKDRESIKEQAIKILRKNVKLASIPQFWLVFAYLLLKRRANYQLFLPHRERYLFSSHISGLLYIILLRLTPKSRVKYYDEGLSFLHILAGTKGYPEESELRNNPLLCLPFQKYFYECLEIKTGRDRRESLIECCQHVDMGTTARKTHGEDGVSDNNLHLISSAYLDYKAAYKLTNMIGNNVNRRIIYPHPNKLKNSPKLPRAFCKTEASGIVEVELERALRKGDFILLGLTSLVPFLVWINEQRSLSLNIAIMLKMPKSAKSLNSHKLMSMFIACLESQKKDRPYIITENRSSKLILLGAFPFAQNDILSALRT